MTTQQKTITYPEDPFLSTVLIEIPRGSNIKYEIKDNKLFCDRVLHTPMSYIFNYGCFENTLAGDGDPLDAVLITDTSFFPGTYVPSRIIGVLMTKDDKGDDEKIICVPAPNIDPTYQNITTLSDLPESTLAQIKFFFQNYKSLERGKTVHVGDFLPPDQALSLYKQSIYRYQTQPQQIKTQQINTQQMNIPNGAMVQCISGNSRVGVFAPKITK